MYWHFRKYFQIDYYRAKNPHLSGYNVKKSEQFYLQEIVSEKQKKHIFFLNNIRNNMIIINNAYKTF